MPRLTDAPGESPGSRSAGSFWLAPVGLLSAELRDRFDLHWTAMRDANSEPLATASRVTAPLKPAVTPAP
jgi:hypothetical protein